MDISSLWTIFLFFFSILACRPITVLIHELGHAFFALLFTKKPVTIFVGSHGDSTKSFVFQLGRLQSFMSFDIFQSQIGLCTHAPAKNIRHTLLIILGGPLASLMFGIFLFYFVKNFQLTPMLEFVGYLLLVSSVFDFFTNMIPSRNPSYLYNGNAVYNDGNYFFKLLKTTKYPESFSKALDFFTQEKYKRAIHNLHLVLEAGHKDKLVYNKLIEACIADHQFERALNIYNTMLAHHKLDTNEYHILATVYWKLENYEKVVLACNKALNQNINSHPSYSNPATILLRGKAYMKLNQLDLAMYDFNQAIVQSSEFTYLGYSYRGLAKIKSNPFQEGKEDLDIAYQLNPTNPVVLFHLGIYFYKKQNFTRAMELFQQAQSFDETNLELDNYIASTLPYLGSQK